MPTYYTPPPSPLPITAPSASPYPSRANSFSHPSANSSSSSSNTTTPSSSRSRHGSDKHAPGDAAATTTTTSSSSKTPYLFLGSIAAASLLAHKYWPRGYPHGDKEDWELSGLARRAKERRRAEKTEKAEKAARRAGAEAAAAVGAAVGGGSRRGSSAGFGVDGGGSRYGDEGRGWGGYHRSVVGGEYGYPDTGRGRGREMVWNESWERGRERGGSFTSHSRSMSRGGHRDHGIDGYVEPPYRRATSRERTERLTTTDRYYPPATHGYFVERSTSTAGSSSSGSRYLLERSPSNAGSRSTSSSRGVYYEEDHPGGVIYIYRNPPARTRRASFDAGGVRRY